MTKRGIAGSFPRNFMQAMTTRQEQIIYASDPWGHALTWYPQADSQKQ